MSFYAIIKTSTGESVGWEVDPSPQRVLPEGYIHALVDVLDLGTDKIDVFLSTHRPVLVDGQFEHWELRPFTLLVELVGDPPANDGSVSAVIQVSGGSASAPINAFTSPGACLNIHTETTLDGSGNLTFHLKAFSGYSVFVSIQPRGHEDFTGVQLDLSPVPGIF